jgi:hypothetical protein
MHCNAPTHIDYRSNEMICHADKGIFVLLYLADNIQTTVSVDDMEKYIQGPCGGEIVFPAARIIEVYIIIFF